MTKNILQCDDCHINFQQFKIEKICALCMQKVLLLMERANRLCKDCNCLRENKRCPMCNKEQGVSDAALVCREFLDSLTDTP